MKKAFIFTIILVLNIYMQNIGKSVNGFTYEDIEKPAVFVKGYDHSNQLLYEGYQIIDSTVNFSLPGTYQVIYQRENSLLTYLKKVTIVEELDLVNNGYYHINHSNIYNSNNDEIILDTIVLNNNTYLIGVKEIDKRVQEEYETIKIICRNNYETLWEFKLFDQSFGNIISINEDNGKIIILTNQIVNNSDYDIGIYILDYKGNLIKSHIFGGNHNDYASNFIITSNYYIICGHTYSQLGNIKGIYNNSDAFIIFLNKDNLRIEKYNCYGIDTNDSFEKLCLWDNHFYILRKFVDNSDIKPIVKYSIIEMNINGEILKENIIERFYGFDPVKLIVGDNNMLYLLANTYDFNNNNKSEIIEINKQLEIKINNKFYNNDANVRAVDIVIKQDSTMTILYKYSGYNNTLNCGYLIRVIKNGKNIVNIKEDNINVSKMQLLNSKDITFICIKEKQVDLVSSSYIKLYPLENKVIINNQNVLYDEEKSIVYKDHKLFGYYQDLYIYNTEHLIFGYVSQYYIDCNISIISDEKYDNHLKITFCGIGYLNNQKITSGFIITKAGQYLLEVLGNNNLKIVVQFEVKDFTSRTEIRNERVQLQGFYQSSIIDNPSIGINFDVKKDIEIWNPDKQNYWYILIPLNLLIITIYMVKRLMK